MTYEQAERLVNRLKNACTFHRFEEPGVNAEYIRFLMKYDHDRMSEAIDIAIEEDSRNVPAISALAKNTGIQRKGLNWCRMKIIAMYAMTKALCS